MLREYARYYDADRPHMSLAGDAPAHRVVEPPSQGRVVAIPKLGGPSPSLLKGCVTRNAPPHHDAQ